MGPKSYEFGPKRYNSQQFLNIFWFNSQDYPSFLQKINCCIIFNSISKWILTHCAVFIHLDLLKRPLFGCGRRAATAVHQYVANRRRRYAAEPAAHNLYKAKRTTINGSGRFRDAGTTLKLYFSTGRPYVVHLYTTAP